MTDAEYHAHPAMGSTRIKAMATGTPRSYWAKHVDPNRKPFQPTEAMRQGSLVDCLITQPEAFDDLYVVPPVDAPKRPTSTQLNAKKPSEATVEAIQFWHDFDADLNGREIIGQDWLGNALRIIEVLSADATIGPILKMERTSQRAHFWLDSEWGIEVKYKSDCETEDGSLFDLKKSASAAPHWFGKQAYSLAYDIQLAHYELGYIDLHGKPPTRYGFIVYQWAWPHECSLIIADQDYIAMGEQRRNEAIDLILECERKNKWPSYGMSTMSPPSFADVPSADGDTDLTELGLEGLE